MTKVKRKRKKKKRGVQRVGERKGPLNENSHCPSKKKHRFSFLSSILLFPFPPFAF